MRRSLILLMVFGLLVAFTGPAAAKPGGGKGPPPKEPSEGRTCEQLVIDGGAVWDLGTYSDGTYSSTRDDGLVCIDIGAGEGDDPANWNGTWTITWAVTGAVHSLYLQIKDSHPGDTCWETEIFPSGNGSGTETPDITWDSEAVELPGDLCGSEWTDPSKPLVFLAMNKVKGKKGLATINYTISHG